MGQPKKRAAATVFAAALALAAGVIGCDRAPGGGAESETRGPSPTHPAARVSPTVASLSPAVTDILLGMGAGDHLVAVSTYDTKKPGAQGLPAAGDYQTFDWERLHQVKPEVLLIQVAKERTPAALTRRAKDMGMRVETIHIDVVADVFTSLRQLGEALSEPTKAADAEASLKRQLDQVSRQVQGQPPVKTLIVTDDSGMGVAGTGTFLDELLTRAGGRNATDQPGYFSMDREKIASLSPDAVLHLIPDATPQVLAKATQFWATMPNLPAQKNGRVYFLTQGYVLQPGLRIGDTAEQFAARLHPTAVRSPSAQPASGRVNSSTGTTP